MAITKNDIAFGNIANALQSVASDHILGVASDIYDTEWNDSDSNNNYQSQINQTLKNKLASVENIPTLINGGVINLSSTGDVENVYNSLKDNGVAICIIGDSNGNYPSTESRINVNSKYCAALSYFFSTDPRGASVGDLLLVSKQKYLGVNICALKIIPINDAKVAGNGYNGVEGIVTIGDKERINKIDGIEWTANNVRDNYLPKSDFLPTRGGENMNECLETGIYVWCTTGRPEGSDGAYTCMTIKSSTPDGNGFYTHNQICLGRSGSNNGQMYQRLVFTNPTTGESDFGYTWKRIDNIDIAVNLSGGAQGSIPYQSDVNTTVFLPAGAAGQVLKMDSAGVPAWSSDNNTDTKVNQTDVTNNNAEYPLLLSLNGHASGTAGEAYYDSGITINPWADSLTIGTVNGDLNGKAKHISGGAKGSIPYQSTLNTTTFLPAGTDGQVLKMGSDGFPVWSSDNIANITDTKVNQTEVINDEEYPLLLSLNGHTSGNAGEAYYDSDITINPYTNTLTIGTVEGFLLGTATLAYNLYSGVANVKGSIPYQTDGVHTEFLKAGVAGQVLKMDSNGLPVWGNDNNTKVTSVGNHYTPAADDGSKLTATASGATAAWGIDVVKGITINRDAKGHVTSVSVTSGKIPSNPNTDTKVKQTVVTDNVEYPLLLSPTGHTPGNAGEAHYDTGVTLNPSLDTLTTKLKLKTSAGMWKSGRTQAAIDYSLSGGIGNTSYHSILGMKSNGGNVVNIGGYQDEFGFYGWNATAVNDTTSENVMPTWSFKFDTSTGNITASGTIGASSLKEGNTLLSNKYVLKANMSDATTTEIEALFDQN